MYIHMLCIAYLFIYIYTSCVVIYRNIYIYIYDIINIVHIHLKTKRTYVSIPCITMPSPRDLKNAWPWIVCVSSVHENLVKFWSESSENWWNYLWKKKHENKNSNQSPSINRWYGWFIVENTTKIWIMIGKYWLVVYLPLWKIWVRQWEGLHPIY